MFKKSQKSGCDCGSGIFMVMLISTVMSFAVIEANASIFYDDFEDGDYAGWLTSWQDGQWGGAYGSWDVVFHNGSYMAQVTHTKGGYHSLARKFDYVNENILSFDMQIGGKTDGGNHAGGNVTLSFLSKFNVKLGQVSLIYSTNPGSIDPAYRIDSNLHHYSASMAEWAEFAGITSTGHVDTLSLQFVAWGQQYSWLQPGSTGTIWFDNVVVIPEPATMSLLAIGGLGLLKRRK